MSTAEVLSRVWLFSGLNEGQLEAVSSFTFQKTFAPGELIVEEGRTGNGLYVIMSGKVNVVKDWGADSERVIATRGPEDFFGEMALLGEWPRTASVIAIDEVECVGIDRWVFLTQLENYPQMGIKMLQVIAQRLRESDARLAE